MTELPDVQKRKDKRNIPINRVGVSGIEFPLLVRQKNDGEQIVHATFGMYASLFRDRKGIDMSRFPEVLMSWTDRPISGTNFQELLTQLRNSVQANDVYVSASFDYFIKKMTPVSKKHTVMAYGCRFIGQIYMRTYTFVLEVVVPVTTLCPCSKEISKYGAHNQRALITLQVRADTEPGPWLEDLVQIIEESSSCELYPLLKRVDEKYVTEKAYNNPRFVEDVTREVMLRIQKIPDVRWVRVKAESLESIHPHSAVAYIERVLKGGRYYRSDHGFF